MPRIQLVVPCFNEAGRLDLPAFLAFVAARPDAGVLFADDGSVDGTPALLAEATLKSAGIDVVTLPRNVGKAAAVRAGVREAFARGAVYVGYWDADLAAPLDAAAEFADYLDAHPGVDIVMGSRVRMLGRRIERRAVRHYLGRVFATGASLALGVGVYDTQCGAKMFRATPIVRQIFEAPFRTRWVMDVEILARYLRARGGTGGEGIVEWPLRAWSDVRGSRLTPWRAAEAAWDLLMIALGRIG